MERFTTEIEHIKQKEASSLGWSEQFSERVPPNCFFLGKGKLFRVNEANKKVSLISNANAQDERNLLYFQSISFDLSYLFKLQMNFFQLIMDVYNQLYNHFCDYLEAKRKTPPPGGFSA